MSLVQACPAFPDQAVRCLLNQLLLLELLDLAQQPAQTHLTLPITTTVHLMASGSGLSLEEFSASQQVKI